MFLLLAPSIFVRFSSVIPFWKAEGLLVLMVQKFCEENLWPMRNQHLKFGYPGGCNFLLRAPMKKIFSQKSLFFKDIFGSKIFFFNLDLLSPLQNAIFWKKHPREKCQKVDPHYFSILMGVCFLPFFQKTTLSASNWLLKIAKNQVFTAQNMFP